MAKRSLFEELDQAVSGVLVHPEAALAADARLAGLVRIAAELTSLPRPGFRARLKSDLERKTSMATATEAVTGIRQTAAPRLRIKGAAAAIEFYKKAFGARENMRFESELMGLVHAEIQIGNSVIMLAEESLQHDMPGPQTLGGSPVTIEMFVEDSDAAVERAVAAGARVTSPVQDHFYGYRAGTVADPFGYSWTISTVKEEMSVEEMHRRFEPMKQQMLKKPAVDPIPKGYRTVTPYIVAEDADGLIEFLKNTFGAEERFRAVGGAGGRHADLRIEDSALMVGGGGAGLAWKGDPIPNAFHIYVRDCDAAYRRALQHGATSIHEPVDQPYGERSASVKDAAGNQWYIATYNGPNYKWEGAPTVQPYMHPLRAEPVMAFLKRVFGAQELGRHASPDGVIHHLMLKIGDAFMEMGEAHGPYQPMPAMYYLFVPDCDAVYRRAIEAGASSISEPADQPYGDRNAGVKDAFGNQWYIATHVKDVGVTTRS
jgi:PhnB protein